MGFDISYFSMTLNQVIYAFSDIFVFCLLTFLFFRKRLINKIDLIIPESILNAKYLLFEIFVVTPMMVFVIMLLLDIVPYFGVMKKFWHELKEFNYVIALVASLMLVDFIDYWRHRISHAGWLWPIHAIHHSDRAPSFLTARRQHALNTLFSTLFSGIILIVLGCPYSLLSISFIIRQYYTYVIHMDIPISYGKFFSYIFVSPLYHRWHHHVDMRKAHSNFAGIFSFYDRIFGTLNIPQSFDVPCGYSEKNFPENGYLNQFIYPFKVWKSRLRR